MSRARSKARRCAIQALYQLQVGDSEEAGGLAEKFAAAWGLGRADAAYFRELVGGVSRRRQHLNDLIAPELTRAAGALDPVERAVLWVGAYELEFRLDVPYRVVLNEAVELAKEFGAEQGHTLVNAVLDRLVARLRPAERTVCQ